jgi:hypothetical protein
MVQETHKVRTLQELKGHSLEDLLHDVARSRESITVLLSEGESVIIKPGGHLKPLPLLKGCLPAGWKDVV